MLSLLATKRLLITLKILGSCGFTLPINTRTSKHVRHVDRQCSAFRQPEKHVKLLGQRLTRSVLIPRLRWRRGYGIDRLHEQG